SKADPFLQCIVPAIHQHRAAARAAIYRTDRDIRGAFIRNARGLRLPGALLQGLPAPCAAVAAMDQAHLWPDIHRVWRIAVGAACTSGAVNSEASIVSILADTMMSASDIRRMSRSM